jgi:hypothetical protein
LVYELNNRGFEYRLGLGIYLYTTATGWLWGPLSLLSSGYQGRKGDSHLRLLPRSRMRGAIPPLPKYAFVAWCSVKTQGLYLYHLPLQNLCEWLWSDARLEVLTAVKIRIEFFWVAAPGCLHIHAEDRGSRELRTIGILPQHDTASQPRKTRLERLWYISMRNFTCLAPTVYKLAWLPCRCFTFYKNIIKREYFFRRSVTK